LSIGKELNLEIDEEFFMQESVTFWPASRAFSGMLRLLLLGVCMATAVSATADDDLSAIRDTVFDYFDGINTVDRERLERAFDASAALKSVDESGSLVVEPIADVKERWMRAEVAERSGEILSVDMAGGQVARVVFDFDGAYVDFLTLAKLGGQWRIIDKVFIRTGAAPPNTAPPNIAQPSTAPPSN